jgi:hypothetical protein
MSNRMAFVAFSVTALAMATRLILLGSKSLWVDEAYAAGLMQSGFADLITMSSRGSPHPPLAFLLLKLSAVLFGTSEAGLRAVPAILGAASTLPLMSIVRRHLGSRPAIWVGVTWALSPFSVSLGQEAWIYASMAFWGFLFVDFCDRAWARGSKLFPLLVPIALAGMLTQHMFALFVIAGLGLYPARPARERVALWVPAAVIVALAALYAPFAGQALGQASLRTERIAASGTPVFAPGRLLSLGPTIVTGLLAGGVTPPVTAGILSEPRYLAGVAVFLAVPIAAMVHFLLDRSVRPGLRIWALAVSLLSLATLLGEAPTVRQLSVLWLPLAMGLGQAFHRLRFAGPCVSLLVGLMLIPYYRSDSFPYHRANWRQAVGMVEETRAAGEMVLVLGGQSGGLAYDYYSRDGLPRIALNGEHPYDVQPVRGGDDPAVVLDSLTSVYPAVWVIHDDWGGPSILECAGGREVDFLQRISPFMEIGRVAGDSRP